MSIPQFVKRLAQRPRIVPGITTANWQSGIATSGNAGADLFTVGVAGLWYRINAGFVISTGFNAAATIYIREYCVIAGAERLVYDDDILMPEPVIQLSWFLDVEIYGYYRIELQSDQAADNGLAVTWEYRIKD